MSAEAINETLDVAVIGAGFGGLAMAQALVDAGIDNYRVFEKADEVGGTWRENTYPGAACDVPSHLYSLSFAPNPHWTRLFPRQPEIQAHLVELGARFRARGVLVFGFRLVDARWDDATALWTLRAADGREARARTLVLAAGGLHVPAWPAIPGREAFAGPSFHSAQWRHDVALEGRRVVVIGTGASAAQFVPEIAPRVAKLTVVQRTPAWIWPRPDVAIPAWLRRTLDAVPPLRLALRGAIWLLFEALASALLRPRTAFWARAIARRHLRRQVPDAALRAQLTPAYPFGCKRLLISSDYYPALQRPNVELVTSAIAAIERGGVRLADGRLVEADVLVYGTGFRPMDLLAGLEIRGRGGRRLADDWRERPETSYGLAVHGYPNLFFLLGPNTALGHNSVLYMIESQVRHVIGALAEAKRRGVRALEPRAAAQQRFMTALDARFPRTA
ncbi:MAG TPA: NAD(P)/FAD-dependent oxidoreductase, partial [Xanthomonadales bacterium]|nr:NAD(P)/FAD-dependent oxidoreductase [Xanthomonadales bacterium]